MRAVAVLETNIDRTNVTAIIPNNKVQIFNRWGSLVYLKDNYNNEWDATVDGVPLPTGAYYYVLDYNNGETAQLCGSITVIR